MPKDTFQTQIIILGLVDYLLVALKSEKNSVDVKNNLLAAIQASFTNKLLTNPETSGILKEVDLSTSDGTDFSKVVDSMQKLMDAKTIQADTAAILKQSAKEVLAEFVTKAQNPDLSNQVSLLLQ